MGLTPDELDTLSRRHLQLGAAAEAIAAERAQIEATIRDAYPQGTETVTPCGAIVRVYRTRRFDDETARAVLPADVVPALEKRVIDAKLAKASLAPVLYAACQKESAQATVSIR